MSKLLLGLATLVAVTVAIACVEEESATNSSEVGEPLAVQTGWTTEQQAHFRTAFFAGEERVRGGILPGLLASAVPTSEGEVACMIDVLKSQYPNDADQIIAEMWIDTIPDDTPDVDDTISDVVFFAWDDEC